jgi:hypothetical protein
VPPDDYDHKGNRRTSRTKGRWVTVDTRQIDAVIQPNGTVLLRAERFWSRATAESKPPSVYYERTTPARLRTTSRRQTVTSRCAARPPPGQRVRCRSSTGQNYDGNESSSDEPGRRGSGSAVGPAPSPESPRRSVSPNGEATRCCGCCSTGPRSGVSPSGQPPSIRWRNETGGSVRSVESVSAWYRRALPLPSGTRPLHFARTCRAVPNPRGRRAARRHTRARRIGHPRGVQTSSRAPTRPRARAGSMQLIGQPLPPSSAVRTTSRRAQRTSTPAGVRSIEISARFSTESTSAWRWRPTTAGRRCGSRSMGGIPPYAETQAYVAPPPWITTIDWTAGRAGHQCPTTSRATTHYRYEARD